MSTRPRRPRAGGTARLVTLAVAGVAALTLGATACGGDDDGTTQPVDAPADATDEGATPVDASEPASADGISDECRAIVVEMLQAIEPHVDGRSAADLDAGDFDADGLSATSPSSRTGSRASAPHSWIRRPRPS